MDSLEYPTFINECPGNFCTSYRLSEQEFIIWNKRLSAPVEKLINHQSKRWIVSLKGDLKKMPGMLTLLRYSHVTLPKTSWLSHTAFTLFAWRWHTSYSQMFMFLCVPVSHCRWRWETGKIHTKKIKNLSIHLSNTITCLLFKLNQYWLCTPSHKNKKYMMMFPLFRDVI